MKTLFFSYLEIVKKRIKSYWYIALIVIAVIVTLNLLFPDVGCCGMKLIFGIPCPTCGMTRSFLALLRFDFVAAFNYHPLFWMIPIIAFVWFFNERPWVSMLFHNKVFWIVCISSFIILYIVRFYFVFPQAPLEYNPNSLRRLLDSLF